MEGFWGGGGWGGKRGARDWGERVSYAKSGWGGEVGGWGGGNRHDPIVIDRLITDH